MNITKISEKYTFSQDGASYIIDFGDVKRAEDKSAVIEISGVEEAGLLELKVTCGCTTQDKTLINKTTARFKLSYNDCSRDFNKVVKINYNKKQLTTILLRGRCNQ